MSDEEKKNNQSIVSDPPYRFAQRVLMISFPTALVLLSFAAMDEIQPLSAILGFCMVVSFNILFTMPFLKNLQSLTQYTNTLAQMQNGPEPELPTLENADDNDESAQIVHAINKMRSIWVTRAEQLEAQTLSDSAVLDSLPDPLLMLDRNGVINGANQAARALFGETVREKSLKELFYTPALITAADSVLSGESKKESLELVLGYRTFSVKIELLPAAANEGAVAVLSLYDITAQKKLEQAQIDFVANASHELKTPLSILSGFIETLQTTARDDPKAQQEFLKIMQAQSARMAQLIQNLLSLSKIQMNEHDEVTEKVDVCEILKAVRLGLKEKAAKNNITLTLKPSAPESVILGDTGELTQVFQNLIDNAIKYAKEGSSVTITCRNEENVDQKRIPYDRLFAVTVHNAGDPIPPELQPRLTERFFRVPSLKNKAGGTGLGLAIVVQILKHHFGALKIQSSAEAGTNFTVYLPIRESVQAPETPDDARGGDPEAQSEESPEDLKTP